MFCVNVVVFSVTESKYGNYIGRAVASIFKMADTDFQLSDISANNEDRNLMLVSISMFSSSEKPNMIHIICQSLVFSSQNGCHFNK